MKLKDIYKTMVEEAMNHDPRGKDFVLKELKKNKEAFENLDKDRRKEFDLETLNNPYADTRILYGDGNREIKSALVGIDIGPDELLLIDRLNAKKKKIDLCISHHPQGVALAGFYNVMPMQADMLANFGVPINITEGLIDERMGEVARRIHSANHNRAVDVARILDIPMLCAHTASDNFVNTYIQGLMDKKKPETLKEIISILKEIPEYQIATLDKAGPLILIGSEKRKAGKIVVEMTGGTEGHKDIFDSYEKAGIGTVIGMHLSEEHYKKAKDKHVNVIIAGHVSSDNIGLNLLLDKVQKKGKLEITACSGFRRIKR